MKVAAIADLHFTCIYAVRWNGTYSTSSAGCCMPRWFVQLDVHWRVAYGRQQLWFHSMHPYIHQIKHAHMRDACIYISRWGLIPLILKDDERVGIYTVHIVAGSK